MAAPSLLPPVSTFHWSSIEHPEVASQDQEVYLPFTPEYLLGKKLRREVSKRVSQLLIDPDEAVRQRAEELHKFMLSPDGMQ